MSSLKRSGDRKTTTLADRQGKRPLVKNAFGLPAGREYSCPGETDFCGRVCYGKKTERYLPAVSRLLHHNFDLLSGADSGAMTILLTEMITDFVKDSDRSGARKWFRIHWDGDFFNDSYTRAWSNVIRDFPDVQFWAYTRVLDAVRILATPKFDNLGLYFSADKDNFGDARAARELGVKIASLGVTFEEASLVHYYVDPSTRVGRCPEVAGKIPLITPRGGACASCALCPTAKVDITFATSGK